MWLISGSGGRVFPPAAAFAQSRRIRLLLLVGACVAVYQVFEHFRHPEFRWLFWLSIFALSVGAILLKKRESTVIDPATGRPTSTIYKRFVLLAVVFGVVLAIDLVYNLSDVAVPLEIRGPFPKCDVTLIMKRKDAQHLQSIPVWAFAHKAEISFDEIEPGPSGIP
jgi:hypothetical protein